VISIFKSTFCHLSLSLLFAGLLLDTLASASPPNILFIMADDVGTEAVECYGGESYPTPNLNRLAAEGLRFEHAYAQPVCHPTRVALMSGQYAMRMGDPKWGTYPKSAEKKTFAHLVKQAGYATAIAGKWQLAMLGQEPDHPHRLGFDHYCLFGWHEGPRYFQPHIRQNGKLRDDVADRYGPDVYCEFLMDFMSKHKDQPFLAYYSMALCHSVTNDLDEPVPFGPNGRYESYAEMMAALDERVGRLLDYLDQTGLRDNTLVMFYTDNGTPQKNIDSFDFETREYITSPIVSRQHGKDVPGGKGLLLDTGIRVPLLARWPGKITPGSTTDQLVDVSDFLPTFAEIAGASLPDNVTLDGRSFAARLRGVDGPERDWIYAERRKGWCLRDQRWKLYDDGRFFDVTQDPLEKSPLRTETLSGEALASFTKLNEGFSTLRADGF